MGFEINPYHPCVANCDIDGNQCTIAWYVDDNKISHVSPDVVSMIIDKIEQHFGKMTVTRGREHTFLGMKVKYNENRTATIDMKSYLIEAIEECGMSIKRQASTPATRSLFDVDTVSEPLDTDKAERFHRIVAKLLYVAIRGRPDILLAVGFLCSKIGRAHV